MKAKSKELLMKIISENIPDSLITLPPNIAIIELNDNVKHLAFVMKRYLDTIYPPSDYSEI